VHRTQDHLAAARSAGLELAQMRDAAIGTDVRSFYASAGRLEAFPNDVGLPIVLALAFRKER
jgi:malonyl-CoA O-methyltransferase